MVSIDPGHENSIKLYRKLANFHLNTKQTTKHVKNAWELEIDFGKTRTNRNRVWWILDSFEQCKDLEWFWRCQGMYWTPQNQLKTAGSMIANSLKVTDFLSLELGFLSNFSVSSWLICIVYIYWMDLRLILERINQYWMEIKFDFFMKIKFSKLDQFQSNLAKFDIIL